MEKTFLAFPSFQSLPPHLRSCKISKVSPLGLFHRRPSCHLRAKSSRGAVEIQWRQLMGSSRCPPRFVCLFDSANGKGNQGADDIAQGAARKALEKALGGKRGAFSKWEETLKREADIGGRGGGRGGRGWFGGGGGWEGFFDFGDDEDGWEEILQVTYASLAVIFLYCMIIAPELMLYYTRYFVGWLIYWMIDIYLWLGLRLAPRFLLYSGWASFYWWPIKLAGDPVIINFSDGESVTINYRDESDRDESDDQRRDDTDDDTDESDDQRRDDTDDDTDESDDQRRDDTDESDRDESDDQRRDDTDEEDQDIF